MNNTPKTGWPPGMLQDDNSALSRWLASKACCICWKRKAKNGS